MLIRAIENRFCFDNLITDGCIETLRILFCESALQQIFRLIIIMTTSFTHDKLNTFYENLWQLNVKIRRWQKRYHHFVLLISKKPYQMQNQRKRGPNALIKLMNGNIIIFHLFTKKRKFRIINKKININSIAISLLFISIPIIASLLIYSTISNEKKYIDISIIQPNIDPYTEKYGRTN